MILTCPQCSARFLLSAFALGPAGRKVKCSSCGEIWLQKPDPDEIGKPEAADNNQKYEKIEVAFQDIPESVKPRKSAAKASSKAKSPGRKAAMAGYAAAFAVFIGVFALLTVARQPIADRWLPAAGFYEMVGFPVVVPGEGLMFDQLTITAEDGSHGEILKIEGRILNLAAETRLVPALLAEIRDEGGKILASVPIPLQAHEIETGQGIDFSATHDAGDTKAAEVRVYFSLMPGAKTAAEDGGNTPAPAPDGETHPHDPEEGA